MFIGQLLNFLNILDNVVSRFAPELSFPDFIKTWDSIASCKSTKECETLANTYAKLIKIIDYINFVVLWTINYKKAFDSIWQSNVSIRKAQNYYIAINSFYLYMGISFLSEVYNMANNPGIGFFTAALVYVSFWQKCFTIANNGITKCNSLFGRYLLRFILFVALLRNLLMKFGGISEQSSNVTMSPVLDPWSSLVHSFKLPSKYRSVITSHLLSKKDMSMISF